MDPIESYFNSFSGKTVAFIGIGRSNLPLIKMFSNYNARVIACDRRNREQLGDNAETAENMGAQLVLGEGYLDGLQVDVVFRTPGMNYYSPELCAMCESGTVVTSEMEAFFDLCPCKIIAVTGSDGKTTTTTLISEMLKAQGKTVFLGGNIGKPLLPEIYSIKPDDYAVVELSSFQLISMKKSPDVAVVTNVTPNHLDVHKDMAEYVNAKKNVVRYQTADNRCVLNLDNEISASFAADTDAQVCYFGSKSTGSGAYLSDGKIRYCSSSGDRAILRTNDILIPGAHNIENYMAAICAVQGIVSDENIVSVAKSFAGVAHRAELVRVLDGVSYYNDSIASSPTRTIRGMLSLFDRKLILICGGYDKKIPYEPIGEPVCKKVKTLILIGATADKIEAAVVSCGSYSEGCPQIIHAENMQQAVELAALSAKQGDIVALSPASASFDMYRDFEQRGEHFRALVNAL